MRPTGHRWRVVKDRFRSDCRRQQRACHICKQAIDYDAAPQTPVAFEADHYLPVATRPDLAYTYSNLRPSHSRCNRARQTSTVQEWVAPTW